MKTWVVLRVTRDPTGLPITAAAAHARISIRTAYTIAAVTLPTLDVSLTLKCLSQTPVESPSFNSKLTEDPRVVNYKSRDSVGMSRSFASCLRVSSMRVSFSSP